MTYNRLKIQHALERAKVPSGEAHEIAQAVEDAIQEGIRVEKERRSWNASGFFLFASMVFFGWAVVWALVPSPR